MWLILILNKIYLHSTSRTWFLTEMLSKFRVCLLCPCVCLLLFVLVLWNWPHSTYYSRHSYTNWLQCGWELTLIKQNLSTIDKSSTLEHWSTLELALPYDQHPLGRNRSECSLEVLVYFQCNCCLNRRSWDEMLKRSST